MPVTDQVDDAGRQTFYRLSQVAELPEYVKKASVPEAFTPQGLPSTAYADTRALKFPCHTKAACYVSNMFFAEKRAELPSGAAERIAERLQGFAERWGILADVQAFQSKHAAFHAPQALTPADYALVDGGECRYPLRNAEEVKTAAAYLLQHRDNGAFTFRERQQMAERITAKAAALGVTFPDELDNELEKQAGRGVYDPGQAAQALRDRGKLLKNAQAQQLLEKLADHLVAEPFLAEDPTLSAELAASLDHMDRSAGLLGKYSSRIPRPEDIFFGGTLKAAREFVNAAAPTLTGSIYDKSQFEKLSVDHVRSLLGEDIAREVTTGLLVDPEKMAAVAVTLPLPDAQTLDRLMESIGQEACRKTATARTLDPELRKKMACVYEAVAQAEVNPAAAPTGMTGSRVIQPRVRK